MALLCACACAATLSAQPVLRLSLPQAQQYALQHNYIMMNASLEVQKAEAARWESLASMLPQVTSQFDYNSMLGYEMKFNMAGGSMSIPMNPYGTFSLTASIAFNAQMLVGRWMSNKAMRVSEIQRQQTELSTLLNVKNAYVSILAMEDVVGLLDSSLANMERLEQTTIESVRAGAAEQISADRLSVQVASLRNSIHANRRQLNLLYNSLILMLGAEPDSRIELTTPLDSILNVSHAAMLASTGFDIERNHDYRLLQESERLSHDQVKLAWCSYSPTVSAFFQYSEKTYFGKDEGMNMTPPRVFGFTVSLPLFQSGARLAKVRQAKIAYQENLNSKRQAEEGLMVSYRQLCFDLMSAIETYQNQRSNIEVCKRVFDNTAEKYRYGRASNVEVTNASTDIISAESNYIQAVLSVVSAQLSLEKLLNRD
ncbi:MAG: transporter [bacterium P3]|nr:MAG: transporter [bacterium P3]KWW41940.1 MAG: transporter [bacterium F083]